MGFQPMGPMEQERTGHQADRDAVSKQPRLTAVHVYRLTLPDGTAGTPGMPCSTEKYEKEFKCRCTNNVPERHQ